MYAQETTWEASSQVYNFDMGFSYSQDDELDFDVSDYVGLAKNYALLIGAQDYNDPAINDLANPIKDCNRLQDALVSYYTFEAENVTVLRNAKKSEIINSLEELSKKITSQDNLLIFYAGHGDWDEQLEIGYWLPVDSKKTDRSTYFPNSVLRDYIKGIKSRHTLLIADACFSGGIFKTRSLGPDASVAVETLYSRKSRKAMTSGELQEVTDQSTFVDFLIKELRTSKDIYLPAERLYYRIKETVMDNSQNGQVPQFGEISQAGNEGGDFIFVRKR
ncbi:MAG: hypothetical protein OHK0038_25580 [Flammeovirgaceae bacterium]